MEAKMTPDHQHLFQVVCDGLDLVQQLWPTPSHATVTLETHEWIRLRRVLLALPDLWMEVEGK